MRLGLFEVDIFFCYSVLLLFLHLRLFLVLSFWKNLMRYTSAQSGLVPQISKATTQGPSTSLFCLFYTLQDSSYSFFLFILQWIHSCLYQLSSRRSYHGAVQQGQRSGKVPEIHIGGWASHHNFPPPSYLSS